MSQLRRILVVGYPGAELLDIACVVTSLQMANHLGPRPIYQLKVASPGGVPIRTAEGLSVDADLTLERIRDPLDTLIVSGGLGYEQAMEDPVLVAHVRRLAALSRRVASVCTGSGILAAAGLLDGRRAATHWSEARQLAARFPAVTFDEQPIFVVDDNVHTSAGVTSALDLVLSFIEEDAGSDLARTVSRHLVTYLQRPGNQAQMSMFNAAPPVRRSLVRDTIDHIEANLGGDLSVSALAERAGVSERHLCRLFDAELGFGPGQFVRRARAQGAAQLLTGTDLTIEGVALRCRYGTVETLRQAFHRTYGVSPSHYRATQSAALTTTGQRE